MSSAWPPAAATTGAALVDHADAIAFTGSVATGRDVAERAARRLIPVSLELGGKDPVIVLADADLERAANATVYYSMQNAGQTCISIERAYVEEPVYDRFVGMVEQRVRALRQGDPAGGPGSVEVGAVTSPLQLEKIAGPRAGGARRRRQGDHRWLAAQRKWAILPAHRARGRDSRHGLPSRRDLRPDAPDREGARRRPGRRARQRLALRAGRHGLHARRPARRGAGAAAGGGQRDGERPLVVLRAARPADGRLEGLGARQPPRARRDPQVLPPADDRGRAPLPAPRAAHVSLPPLA